ncbi:MAG: hemolysin family protein [Patescibacteria group bacterium]|nr:hemolysin family protein [Patescibacteria group bacterium]
MLVLSGFFSGAEIAFVSLTPAKVQSLLLNKPTALVKTLHRLKEDEQKLLITILVGNNLVNIGASVFSTVVFAKIFGEGSLAIATGVMTLGILIFGEITPKTLATKHAEGFALFSTPIISFLQFILTPVVWLLEGVLWGIMKIFGVSPQLSRYSESELKAMLHIGAEEGLVDEDEKELIENVLDLDETKAEDIMTPRSKIVMISHESTVQEAIDMFLQESHSRMPIYGETQDEIIGVITVHTILKYTKENNLSLQLKDIAYLEAIFVPETKNVSDLLADFQTGGNHMAIVLDAHGGVSGLLTMEDMLEEIVGEIHDETDSKEFIMRKVSDTVCRAAGTAEIDDILKEFGLYIPEDMEHKIVSQVVLDKLGDFPVKDQTIDFEFFKVVVEKMNNNVIERVKIIQKTTEELSEE